MLLLTPPAPLDSLLAVCLEQNKIKSGVLSVLGPSYCREKKELNYIWSCSVSTGKEPSIFLVK